MPSPSEQDPFQQFGAPTADVEVLTQIMQVHEQAENILEAWGIRDETHTYTYPFTDGARMELSAAFAPTEPTPSDDGGVHDEPQVIASEMHSLEIFGPADEQNYSASLLRLSFDSEHRLRGERQPGVNCADAQATAAYISWLTHEMSDTIDGNRAEIYVGLFLRLYTEAFQHSPDTFKDLHSEAHMSKLSSSIAEWLQTAEDASVKQTIRQYAPPSAHPFAFIVEYPAGSQPAEAVQPQLQIRIPRPHGQPTLVYERWPGGNCICFEQASPGYHPRQNFDYDPLNYTPTQKQVEEMLAALDKVIDTQLVHDESQDDAESEELDTNHNPEISMLIYACEKVLVEEEGPFWLVQSGTIPRGETLHLRSTTICDDLTRAVAELYHVRPRFPDSRPITDPLSLSKLYLQDPRVVVETDSHIVTLTSKPGAYDWVTFIRVVQAETSLDGEKYFGPHILCTYDLIECTENLQTGRHIGLVPLKRANIPRELQLRRFS